MKNVTMIQILLMIVCLLAFQVASGQQDFVVLTQGDTLKGKVKFLNYGVEKKIQITTPDTKKTVYNILQTLSFSMGNDVYQPVRITQGYVYMKVIKSGYLSLFAFQLQDQSMWDGRYLLKKDGTGLEVPNIGFKRNMTKYLSECPTVSEKIESGELGKLEIEEIINQYNACIDRNTSMHNLIIENEKDQAEKLKPWTELENSLNNGGEFEDKATALEMINEIKIKLQREEKVPGFLVEGLKESLKDQDPPIKEILEKALQQLQ
jgi:hypothetical protein